jgi:tetratricopeptide (TPR) repeat protein
MRRLGWLVLAVGLFPLSASGQKWVEIRSPHFVVATDAGDGRGRDIALRFEQMRAVFGQLISKDKVSAPVPLQIVAFRSSQELRRLAPIYNGKPVQLAGFFAAGDDRSYIGLDLSAPNSWQAVFHEYAHSLLNGNYPRTDAWFDEGMAEYFSTIDMAAGMVELGKPPMNALDLLHQTRWIPLADLFRVQHDSRTYNEGEQRNIFYAESWLVVHYLETTQKLRQAAVYFDLVKNRRVPVEQAITQAFGLTPAQLQQDIEKYLSSSRAVYRRYKLPLEVESAHTYLARSLPTIESQAMLADFALHSPGHEEEGVQQLQQVVDHQPSDAPAQRSLGYAYLRKNNFTAAAAHFSRAAALDTKDPWVFYYSALLRSREALTAGHPPPFEEIVASQRDLHRAIALNPQFADAYHLLGIAEMATGNYESAIQDLVAAVEMSPRDERYLANLGNAYLMARKWDAAKTILEQVKTSDNPEIANMAAHDLAQMQEMKDRPAYQEIPSRMPADYTAPQWRPKEKPAPAPAPGQPQPASPAQATAQGPVLFAKGTLKSINCSAAPSATLIITSGARTLTLETADVKHTVVVGAGSFSCDWANRRVAVNYRRSGPGTGALVSIELE